MTAESPLEEPSAEDEIFATTAYTPASRPGRSFEPWHRPRKQFVRRKQWLKQTGLLMDDLPAATSIRYLGLPGTDLLDVRAIHQELCDNGKTLRFLGFSNSATAQAERLNLEISLQEVKALTNVDEQSIVLRDDIRTLARHDSMGFKEARDAGPFDVINIDLCDNLLHEAVGSDSIYEALARLFGLQNRRLDPWLLFVTTRVDRGAVGEDAETRLDALLAQNLAGCEPFAEALKGLAGGGDSPLSLGECHDEHWLSMFCVALSKWVLTRAVEHSSTMEVRSTMSYSVNDGADGDDLASLAFRLTPSLAPAPDASGLSGDAAVPLDECELAAKVPGRTSKRVAVDDVLAADTDLRDQMAVETAELLGKARYSVDAYIDWALPG